MDGAVAVDGIIDAYGMLIPVSFAVALLVSLITGFGTVKGAMTAFLLLLIVSIALSFPPLSRLGELVLLLPIYVLGFTVGLFGALPGASAGGWLRSKMVRKEN